MSHKATGQQAGNYYAKYAAKRRADGKLCLDDPLDDLICRVIADGVDPADVPSHLIDEGVTEERVSSLLVRLEGQRRIAYLKRQIEKQNPDTPDECLTFVKTSLVKLGQEAGKDSDKINALKALHEVALEEREHSPAPKTTPNAALEKLGQLTMADKKNA